MALFSSLMIFGVNCMIRKQSIARRQLGFKNDTSLNISEAETAPDSVYKNTESQPMLEEEHIVTNKLCKLHCALRTSKELLVVERETVI